jgi:S-DNA-T family DNA segregation ATPase FtsK/SpoIIIE
VGAILPRRSSTVVARFAGPDISVLDALPADGPVLLLVDDAEAVDDPGGRLAALAAGARPGTCIVAAGRPDALRQLYGHWTTVVRRSRTGVVLTGGSDVDGDLLGVVLPRRTPVPARPGLAWLVSDGRVQLLQIAAPDEPDRSRPGPQPLASVQASTV